MTMEFTAVRVRAYFNDESSCPDLDARQVKAVLAVHCESIVTSLIST